MHGYVMVVPLPNPVERISKGATFEKQLIKQLSSFLYQFQNNSSKQFDVTRSSRVRFNTFIMMHREFASEWTYPSEDFLDSPTTVAMPDSFSVASTFGITTSFKDESFSSTAVEHDRRELKTRRT